MIVFTFCSLFFRLLNSLSFLFPFSLSLSLSLSLSPLTINVTFTVYVCNQFPVFLLLGHFLHLFGFSLESRLRIAPYEDDRKATLSGPVNIAEWVEKHADEIELYGRKAFCDELQFTSRVYVYGGYTSRRHFIQAQSSEEIFLLQLVSVFPSLPSPLPNVSLFCHTCSIFFLHTFLSYIFLFRSLFFLPSYRNDSSFKVCDVFYERAKEKSDHSRRMNSQQQQQQQFPLKIFFIEFREK